MHVILPDGQLGALHIAKIQDESDSPGHMAWVALGTSEGPWQYLDRGFQQQLKFVSPGS